MFSKAFIQEQGNGKLRHEEDLVVKVLMSRNIPIQYYTEKRIHRRQLPLDSSSLVVGDMPCIYGALKQLSITVPVPNSYPESLHDFLHRRVWESTVNQLQSHIRDGHWPEVFAKPATQQKRFIGQVFQSEADFYALYGISKRDKIVCSEVVTWLSEYRVYVVNSEIRAVDYYAGDKSAALDLSTVEQAVMALDKANESYSGYAIDFGVLSTGVTALIEMNDGFAVGAYQIDAENYTDMIIARWHQLLGQIKNPDIRK